MGRRRKREEKKKKKKKKKRKIKLMFCDIFLLKEKKERKKEKKKTKQNHIYIKRIFFLIVFPLYYIGMVWFDNFAHSASKANFWIKENWVPRLEGSNHPLADDINILDG